MGKGTRYFDSTAWGHRWHRWNGHHHSPKKPSSHPAPGSGGSSSSEPTGPTTTLTVTFQSEEAGYANAMGWYNARTGEAGILFKNLNDDGCNAGVKAGDTRSLTALQSDVDANNIGFFLIPNGANTLSSALLSSTMKFQVGSNGDGKIVIDRQYGSDVVLSGNSVLFSNQVYNKGDFDYVSGKVGTAGQTRQQRNGSQSDGPDGILGTMAWDDQAMRSCGGTDRDFNDVVFTVTKQGGGTPPANRAPTDISLSGTTISENVAGGVIGMLATSDPDAGDKHTYSVSDSRFEVVNGELKLKSGMSLNYEAGNSVQLNVTTTDQGGLSHTEGFTIKVSDVNEAPTGISITNLLVDENASGAVIGKLSTVDPDAGNTHTYKVSDDRFEVVSGELKLKSGVSLDYEAPGGDSVQVTVTSTDQGGLSHSENFTIKVNDVGEAPPNSAPTDIDLTGGTVTENVVGAVVGTLTTTDPDAGDSHTYTVDDDRFEVVGGTLQLKSGVSLNYEDASSVVVNVTTTDKDGLSYTEGFTVNVLNTTEAPTDITLSPFLVDENEPGAAVGKLSTADDDVGDVHTYTVSDKRFVVDGDQLLLEEETALDFESGSTVVLDVTSTDSQGNSFTKAITVVVKDLNEAPTNPVDDDPAPDSVAVDAAVGTVVGIDVSSVDPDLGDSFKFSLSNNANGMFTIDQSTGVVTVAGPLQEGTQTITVRATDSSGEHTESDFFIQVGDGALELMAFGSGGMDTFLLDLAQEAVTTLVGFNRANDRLSFSGVADADANGSIGLNDLFAMVSGVSDFGSGGDIVVDFNSGASLVLQGAGTPGGSVTSMSNLVSSPSTQYQFA